MQTIQLFDDITNATLPMIASYLNDAPDGDDICLQIFSSGGLVFCAFGILDYFRSRKFHVTAEVLGMAASAAALLALASDVVRMSSFGSIMMHPAYIDGDESGEDEGVKRANDIQLSIIHRRCPGFTDADLKSGHWYGVDEALAMGLCDERLDTEPVRALCNVYLSRSGKEVKMDKEEKKTPCAEVEEPRKEDVNAAEGDVSGEDLIEKLIERLDVIEHRLAVLEGEGKKEDDIAEEEGGNVDIAARRKALYARITAPQPMPPARLRAASERKSKIDLSGFIK